MWKESYRTEIDLIDRQHRELFNRASRFVRSVIEEKDLEENSDYIQETLYFLEEYCFEHFRAEEEYQKKIGYKDYGKHKKEHDGFQEDIAYYRRKVEVDGLEIEDLKIIAAKIVIWLKFHVGYEDMKISEHAKKGGYIK